MSTRSRTEALLTFLAVFLTVTLPASAIEGMHDIRRPLVPGQVPSWEAYSLCYQSELEASRWLTPESRAKQALSKIRAGISDFEHMAPEESSLPFRIDRTTQVLRRNPFDALAAELLGVWLTLQHELPSAVESLVEAARLADELSARIDRPEVVAECLGGSAGRIRVNLANTALLAGELDLARRSLSEIRDPSELSMEASLLYHWLGAEVAALGGDLDAALEKLKRAEDLELPEEDDPVGAPRLASATMRAAAQAFFRGTVAFQARDWEQAESFFRVAAEGGLLDARIERARALAELGRFEEGADLLDELNKSDLKGEMMKPEVVAYDLGNLRLALGDRDGALNAFQSALYTVAERSCKFLQGADHYIGAFCDLDEPCARAEEVSVRTACHPHLSCVEPFFRRPATTWWEHTLCASLEPDVFVAAHNNFAMTLAADPGQKKAVEKHLTSAIEGARGTEAARIPRLNLARTRWERGEREAALAAIRELAEQEDAPELAARSLWEWIDAGQEIEVKDLAASRVFVALAHRSSLHGARSFSRELAVLEESLVTLVESNQVAPMDREQMRELLVAIQLPPSANLPLGDTNQAPLDLRDKVRQRLAADPEINPFNIDVEITSDGVVLLRGVVKDPATRRELIRLARNTDGVTRVINDIRIGEDPADDALDYAAIIATIKTAFSADPMVKALDIRVDIVDGVVHLSGTVSSAAEKDAAGRIARNIEGVKRVVNHLTVG